MARRARHLDGLAWLGGVVGSTLARGGGGVRRGGGECVRVAPAGGVALLRSGRSGRVSHRRRRLQHLRRPRHLDLRRRGRAVDAVPVQPAGPGRLPATLVDGDRIDGRLPYVPSQALARSGSRLLHVGTSCRVPPDGAGRAGHISDETLQLTWPSTRSRRSVLTSRFVSVKNITISLSADEDFDLPGGKGTSGGLAPAGSPRPAYRYLRVRSNRGFQPIE
jgi:hypothetical protein